MAIGFSLSKVIDTEPNKEEKAIYFELKNIRYKIIFDDKEKAEELIKQIKHVMSEESTKKDIQPLPDFYKEG